MKALTIALALTLVSTTAMAQQQCNTQDKVHERLGGEKYKESVIAAGVTNTGHLVEILTNEVTGGFSIILTTPGKRSCLAISGDGFIMKTDEQRLWEAIENLPQY